MKRFPRSLVFGILILTASCASRPETAVDRATVTMNHASLRLKNSSNSRTIATFDVGEKVEILERQDNWYRVRSGDLQGWMEESTVVSNVTLEKIQGLAAAAKNEKAQNTGALTQDANLRIEPGRTTAVIRKVQSHTKLEVLSHKAVPRGGTAGGVEGWLKVRISPTEAGWLLGNLVEFNVPEEISQYTEERIYPAVQILNDVQDPVAGTVHWYVVGERVHGIDPNLDFDGMRVFTWNLSKHRYETAFRIKGLRAVYPLEVDRTGATIRIRVHEIAPDTQTPSVREFVMNGVIVREAKKKS
jgi:hypothetical protein